MILTFHNRHEMVKRAISRILDQSINCFELILVDDCSDEQILLQEFDFKEIQFTYLRNKKNKGANQSRLNGLMKAKGEYICFHDDDDYWMKNKLEKQLNFLEENPEYYLVSSFAKTHNKLLKFPLNPSKTALSIYNCLGSFSIPMIRNNKILNSSLDNNLSNAQDWNVWRNIQKNYLVATIPEILVFFDDGTHDRISSKKNNKEYYSAYLEVALNDCPNILVRYYHMTLSAYHCTEDILIKYFYGFLTLLLRLYIKIKLLFEK